MNKVEQVEDSHELLDTIIADMPMSAVCGRVADLYPARDPLRSDLAIIELD
jgi:hypothetical protein